MVAAVQPKLKPYREKMGSVKFLRQGWMENRPLAKVAKGFTITNTLTTG